MPGNFTRGNQSFYASHGEIPEAPLLSVGLMGVSALLLLLYAGWLARSHGFNGLVRNYLIAAGVLMALTAVFALARL